MDELTQPATKPSASTSQAMRTRVDLFVLNYNGAEYICKTIESLFKAIENSSHVCELIVIDNSSTDKSLEVIHKHFPRLPILSLANRVLCSFNEAAKRSSANIMFQLNNDITVEPNFIDPMVKVFQECSDVFLVSPKSYLFSGEYEGGRSRPQMRLGHFGTTAFSAGFEKTIDEPSITFATGFGAFDRAKFLALGGYDEMYLPGRLEDSDLGFRAWKMGWKCYYEPKSVLHHMGAKSFKAAFGSKGTMELAHRNSFLFMWKHIRSVRYWALHITTLIPRLMWMALTGRFEYVSAFFKAFVKLPLALERRKTEKKIQYQLTDKEVFDLFQHGN